MREEEVTILVAVQEGRSVFIVEHCNKYHVRPMQDTIPAYKLLERVIDNINFSLTMGQKMPSLRYALVDEYFFKFHEDTILNTIKRTGLQLLSPTFIRI